jgi:hypothetical protein
MCLTPGKVILRPISVSFPATLQLELSYRYCEAVTLYQNCVHGILVCLRNMSF